MRRPKKEVERFVKVSELKIPMTYQIEFDRPVTIREAREIARRILDHLQGPEDPEIENDAFAEAKLKCATLKRIVMLAQKD